MNQSAALVAILGLCTAVSVTRGQEPVTEADNVTADERQAVVETIGEMLEERYVFPDVAVACRKHLAAQLEAGEFDGLTDPEAFSERLTESLQSVSHDKHLRVRVRPADRVRIQDSNPSQARARQKDRARRSNYGFQRVERLDGNVGYLDMRYFDGSPEARGTAAAAMQFLGNSDAIIFDMRKNGGGSPGMIRFVCSYLFDEPTHLNSLYWREGDRTEEFWTLEDIPGSRMADVPVFVLTSSYTFSGAEEFCYNLQTRKRGTLVGETTGGGANPGGTFPINQRFGVFIPTGRAINPVTGINWEGTGVKPDVAVAADDALDTALPLARGAAESRRERHEERMAAIWESLERRQRTAAEHAEAGRHAEAAVIMAAVLEEARERGLLGEGEINMLGYEMLGRGHHELAIAVFQFNVDAYPQSANVYDSLGEAYMEDGQFEPAIRHYRRSLELDPNNSNAEAMIRRMQPRRLRPPDDAASGR